MPDGWEPGDPVVLLPPDTITGTDGTYTLEADGNTLTQWDVLRLSAFGMRFIAAYAQGQVVDVRESLRQRNLLHHFRFEPFPDPES